VRVRRIAARLAKRAPLTEQIPAPIQLDLERPKPGAFLVCADLAALHLVAQFLLLGDKRVDVRKSVVVLCHIHSVPASVVLVTDKPEIDFPSGPAPAELVIEDITVGDGAEAVPGGTVEVHYVGVEYDTGEEFDSSWNRGQTIEFPLRGLIQGWQDGIPGMRVGGRRKLTIPPAQAYGPAGSGHRLSGKTLIFVIDLLGTR
jgi:peptidylprolyl isomerase